MNPTTKTAVMVIVLSLVTALAVVFGARALSPVYETTTPELIVQAPDGSVIGKTQPVVHASSGPPVPACSIVDTVLTCQGAGINPNWQFPTIDGAVPGNVVATALTGTSTCGADGGPTTVVFTIPVAPNGSDAASYTGGCNINASQFWRMTNGGVAQQVWVGANWGISVFNDGGGGVNLGVQGGGVAQPQGSPSNPIFFGGYSDAAADATTNPTLVSYSVSGGNVVVTYQTNSCAGLDGGDVFDWTLTYTNTCSAN